MKSWYEIYRERMNEKYVQHVAYKYAPFLGEIYRTGGRAFTEIGCGAGTITRVLREMLQDTEKAHDLIDSCPNMLGLAIQNNPVFNCRFRCADVRTTLLRSTDVVHSHGLLEHFNDENIKMIVESAWTGASVQIHYVPGAKYTVPSRGDERLMEPDQWEDILKRVGRTSISTFNEDHDIIIRVERR